VRNSLVFSDDQDRKDRGGDTPLTRSFLFLVADGEMTDASVLDSLADLLIDKDREGGTGDAQ
jgi:hypothetical protein